MNSSDSSLKKSAAGTFAPEQAADHGGIGPVFTPDQVVYALIGQRSIVLDGFGELDDQLGRQLPNVPLSLLENQSAQEQFVAQSNRVWMWRKGGLAVTALVLVLVLGLVFGGLLRGTGGRATEAEAVVWRVTKVQSDGVMVLLAGKEMLFPLGGMLPSGEDLRYVDPVTQTFTTNAQSVTLRVK